jgi:DNA-binding PadR family transcriptional regulator
MVIGEFKILRAMIEHGGTWRGVSDGWVVYGGGVMTNVCRRLAKRGWLDERQEEGRTVFTINKIGRAKFRADPKNKE